MQLGNRLDRWVKQRDPNGIAATAAIVIKSEETTQLSPGEYNRSSFAMTLGSAFASRSRPWMDCKHRVRPSPLTSEVNV